MVLVLLGTSSNNFNRLIKEIQICIDDHIIKDEIIVQAGGTKIVNNDIQSFTLIPQERLDNLIEKADIIITHGGVGSIVNCLKHKKKIIAVPRRQEYNEAVNDHQIQIVESFNKLGYIIGLKDVSELQSALNRVKDFEPQEFVSNTQNIINIIRNFIDNN